MCAAPACYLAKSIGFADIEQPFTIIQLISFHNSYHLGVGNPTGELERLIKSNYERIDSQIEIVYGAP